MGFVQKHSRLHFDYTTQALSDTPVNYRLVNDKYLEGNQNFVYSDFVYFFVDNDSEQILASTGRYFVTSSRSGRLYREDFREFMDTYAHNQGVTITAPGKILTSERQRRGNREVNNRPNIFSLSV